MKHVRAEIGIDSVLTFVISERILSGLLSKESLEREINPAIDYIGTLEVNSAGKIQGILVLSQFWVYYPDLVISLELLFPPI